MTPDSAPASALAPSPAPAAAHASARRGTSRGTRLLAATLSLLLATAGAPAHAQVRLPSLGEAASEDLSVGAERRLGDQIMLEGRRDPSYYDDPVLLDYVRSLWRPLVDAARARGEIGPDIDRAFAWEIFLLRERSVNAFALPGGYVGVHLGLIAITSTRDQLASVLAHELSHVTQRHIARSIAPQARASMLALATLLLGIIAAGRTGNADIANAAIMGGQGAAIQNQLNFSREMEREADRIGYGVMQGAGFSIAGMGAMFEKLDTATRLNDSGGFPYLRSHPLTIDRISEARNRGLLADRVESAPPLRHLLMQARARVLMDGGAQALQRQTGATASSSPDERIAALYAGALAASLLNDAARAESQAAQALQLTMSDARRDADAVAALHALQAQVLLRAGRPDAAIAAIDASPDAAAGRPARLLRAQAAIDLHRRTAGAGGSAATLRDTAESLQTWLADHADDAAAWELLAQADAALGRTLRSMRAGAEARAAVGDLSGAVDRLRAAQAASRTAAAQDFIEASVIDSRLRQLVAQRRELALEARGRGGPDPTDPR